MTNSESSLMASPKSLGVERWTLRTLLGFHQNRVAGFPRPTRKKLAASRRKVRACEPLSAPIMNPLLDCLDSQSRSPASLPSTSPPSRKVGPWPTQLRRHGWALGVFHVPASIEIRTTITITITSTIPYTRIRPRSNRLAQSVGAQFSSSDFLRVCVLRHWWYDFDKKHSHRPNR